MKTLLLDNETVGSVVCQAAAAQFGDGWLLWEPETLWLELDMPLGNRQQLMAGRGLLVHGRAFYDGLVFDRTCAAMNNEVLEIDEVDEAETMHMAWAVNEMLRICEVFEDPPLNFDREAVETVAEQLREEGFVLAPEELKFAQGSLDRRWGSAGTKLKQEVSELWDALQVHDLKSVPFPETAVGVQLARLAATRLYVQERSALRRKQANQLQSSVVRGLRR